MGNSDINPDTGYGEMASVLMMIIGIAFVGILTTSLASWLISKSNKEEDDKVEERLKSIESSMDEIKNEVFDLKRIIKNKF